MSDTEKTATPETPCDAKKNDESCECGAKSGCMPEVSFTTFVLSIASSGLVQLGEVPDPNSGQTQENLLMAKHTIDVLCMLREKTKGSLDDDETKLMEALLYELRMKYVLKSK